MIKFCSLKALQFTLLLNNDVLTPQFNLKQIGTKNFQIDFSWNQNIIIQPSFDHFLLI